MNQYIITLTRNMGIGNDIENFFKNRGINVVREDRKTLEKTVIVETIYTPSELSELMYVGDVKELREGVLI